MKYRSIAVVTLGLGGVAASAGVADAYTMDATGKGFVGKGEVQFAFGWNNAVMQKAVDSGKITFSTKQNAEQLYSQTASQLTATQPITQVAYETGRQSASQTATQTGTQTASQDVTETLRCTNSNGQEEQLSRHGVRLAERSATRTVERTDTREATREAIHEGVRTGTRWGGRTGSRAGVLTGNVSSDVAYENKKTGQYTGFNLKGATPPVFTSIGSLVWHEPGWGQATWTNTIFSDYVFPDYVFPAWQFGPYEFGPYEFPAYEFGPAGSFGPWDTDNDPNADPDVCLNNANIVPGSLVQEFTYGDIVESPVVDGPVVEGPVREGPVTSVTFNQADPQYGEIEGPITYGPVVQGATNPTGPTILHVTYQGVTKALTPTV